MTARDDSKGRSSVDDKAKCDEDDDLIGREKPAKLGTEIGLESRPGGLTQSGNPIPMPNAFPTDPTQHFNSP
ncbi:uncharacterized protein FFUJ_09779 [Fusarium fujikuroi IMI 58289]|uniref:Uncharacterized protein n=2 Tax=Fusarium fujikuroi TaxID=5127 RepID=S0EF78_GIBF5|nr:uncharacterized protein FFUJ_09779 [Fusarium fujikuroi IMI 58289]KLP10756.1 uncharacterized protein LW94_4649 [Fusarium fujikuroi]KLP12202.1 uncharacterized protein Y057_11912 [Fusarium fujikuroi]QGI69045.1 hypothetical protein CEK27_013016 [Fusarium fujikuroi]QGI86413.1 hypothetical protein CEK25_013142 [Fusarium fujikuroi]QGI99934.1 hypothetical protein CEK26_013003 [Fusarium fujikuroi]